MNGEGGLESRWFRRWRARRVGQGAVCQKGLESGRLGKCGGLGVVVSTIRAVWRGRVRRGVPGVIEEVAIRVLYESLRWRRILLNWILLVVHQLRNGSKLWDDVL